MENKKRVFISYLIAILIAYILIVITGLSKIASDNPPTISSYILGFLGDLIIVYFLTKYTIEKRKFIVLRTMVIKSTFSVLTALLIFPQKAANFSNSLFKMLNQNNILVSLLAILIFLITPFIMSFLAVALIRFLGVVVYKILSFFDKNKI